MSVAQMPFLTWDSQKNRAVYQRRFPKDVTPLLGTWFRFKYPGSLSFRDAMDISHEQTAEFMSLVDQARERLGTAEGMKTALRMSRERMAGMRDRIAAIRDVLVGMDDGIQRIKDKAALYRLGARIGVAITEPDAVRVVDTEGVIEAWIAERIADNNPPKKRAVTNKHNKLAEMLAYTGKPHLGAVTEDDLLAYRRHLLKKGMAGDMPSLANDHLKEVKPMFAVAKRAGLITTNPAAELHVPSKPRNKRPPFSDAEARKVLVAARNCHDPVIRWSNWLAAFTTAINSEILEAQASEFYQTPNGQWVFDMRGRQLKTGFRPRIVPLHPSIIRETFPAYLETRRGKPLFDGHPASNKNRLNRFIHRIDLDGKSITKTFYSWRHRVIHWLDNKIKVNGERISPSLSRYIAGHAAKDIHESFYNHHELPEEFGEIVAVIEKLADPTQGEGDPPSSIVGGAARDIGGGRGEGHRRRARRGT